jgi:hypothetical protein
MVSKRIMPQTGTAVATAVAEATLNPYFTGISILLV